MHPGSESPSAPSNAQNKSAVDLFLFGVAISCLTGEWCVYLEWFVILALDFTLCFFSRAFQEEFSYTVFIATLLC